MYFESTLDEVTSDFYELDRHEDRMRFLLRYAVLAPSAHNRQPWLFRVVPEGVAVYADTERRLGVSDPQDRELLLGVGAAIANFRVAAARFGYATTVQYSTRPEQSLPVATIVTHETCLPSAELAPLFPAIGHRHTDRRPFKGTIDYDAARQIADFADRYDDVIMIVPSTARVAAASLVAEGARQLMGNPDFRNEIASCIRTDADQHDGLPAAAFGVPDAFGGVLRSAIRNVDFGAVAAKRLRNLTLQSAALVAIMSDDDRVSLLRAGEVLELMLLTLTRLGVHYSFLNQPLEVPALRSQTEHLFRSRKPLQLVLRIGYCDGEVAATARRSLDVAILRS